MLMLYNPQRVGHMPHGEVISFDDMLHMDNKVRLRLNYVLFR